MGAYKIQEISKSVQLKKTGLFAQATLDRAIDLKRKNKRLTWTEITAKLKSEGHSRVDGKPIKALELNVAVINSKKGADLRARYRGRNKSSMNNVSHIVDFRNTNTASHDILKQTARDMSFLADFPGLTREDREKICIHFRSN